MPPPAGITEGPDEVLLCGGSCTISRGPGWHKGQLRAASERVQLCLCVFIHLPSRACSVLCLVLPWRSSPSRGGPVFEPELQNAMMNPLEENKWELRGEDLIPGGEASREKVGKSYPGAKGWEGCPKERNSIRKAWR